MTNNQRVELDNDEAYSGYAVAHVLGWVVLGLLLGIVLSPNVLSQEVEIGDVPQKELEGLPVKEGGVIEQTWNWFIGLLGYDVPDVEVVKRSILEQDLDIEDVRMVNVQDTVEGAYQVFVTPTQTYDVPPKTTCYDDGDEYVCESTLRCDGIPGLEYGCEHVIIKKLPATDGRIDSINIGSAPIRSFVARKDVITSAELVADEELTMRIPDEIVESVKTDMIVVTE